jgi:hypothetical protein
VQPRGEVCSRVDRPAALDDALPLRGPSALDGRVELEALPAGVEDRAAGRAGVLHAGHRESGVLGGVECPLDPLQAVAQARVADAQRQVGVLVLHVDEDKRPARDGSD